MEGACLKGRGDADLAHFLSRKETNMERGKGRTSNNIVKFTKERSQSMKRRQLRTPRLVGDEVRKGACRGSVTVDLESGCLRATSGSEQCWLTFRDSCFSRALQGLQGRRCRAVLRFQLRCLTTGASSG
jgi:hypothetical protein